jgi:hypothetical protein
VGPLGAETRGSNPAGPQAFSPLTNPLVKASSSLWVGFPHQSSHLNISKLTRPFLRKVDRDGTRRNHQTTRVKSQEKRSPQNREVSGMGKKDRALSGKSKVQIKRYSLSPFQQKMGLCVERIRSITLGAACLLNVPHRSQLVTCFSSAIYFHNNPLRRALSWSPFFRKETEAQRGEVSCPKLHG